MQRLTTELFPSVAAKCGCGRASFFSRRAGSRQTDKQKENESIQKAIQGVSGKGGRNRREPQLRGYRDREKIYRWRTQGSLEGSEVTGEFLGGIPATAWRTRSDTGAGTNKKQGHRKRKPPKRAAFFMDGAGKSFSSLHILHVILYIFDF